MPTIICCISPMPCPAVIIQPIPFVERTISAATTAAPRLEMAICKPVKIYGTDEGMTIDVNIFRSLHPSMRAAPISSGSTDFAPV